MTLSWYNVNGKTVLAKSNNWAIVSLYPCLAFAVSSGTLSLTKAVSLTNQTFGLHISRSQQAYLSSQNAYYYHQLSLGLI